MNPLFHDGMEEIRKVRHDLESLNKEKARGALIHSKCNWALLAERPTKYFLNLEKQRAINKTLYQIKSEKGETITVPSEILSEIRRYYDKLYTKTEHSDMTYLDKLNLPQIPNEVREDLESEITMTEVSRALQDLDNSKSPSTDGLPAKFYKCFWFKLKDLLFGTIKEIAATGKMHLSACRGILSLLENVTVTLYDSNRGGPLPYLMQTIRSILNWWWTDFRRPSHILSTIPRQGLWNLDT